MKGARIFLIVLVVGFVTGGALLLRMGCSSDEKFAADRSTPQAAAITLYNAIDTLNAAEIRSSFAGDADANYVKAHVDAIEAFAAMNKSASDKYGNDVPRQIGGTLFVDLNRLKFQGNPETVPDRATLKSIDGREIQLKKESGQWKIMAEKSNESVTLLTGFAGNFNEVKDKIVAGAYSADKDEAIKAIRKDLEAARDRVLK